jgi:sortase A
MIVGGVVLIAYVPATWAYTWFQQRDLRQQLETDNPQVTSVAASPSANDLTPISTTTTTLSASTNGVGDDAAAATAAAVAAAAKLQAQLDAFRAAADAYALSASGNTGKPIGKIVIPSIGLNVVMVEGTGKGDLKIGPGHWPETPFPGEGGNFVVSGHRTTYGAPFFKLNKVKVGDEIDLVLPYAVARYTATRVIIVLPTEVNQVAQLGREQVSLAACHPIYSAKQRIVVQGDLTGFKLINGES